MLPRESPWLNPIEPKWVHGKRRVVEPNGLLTTNALAERVCAAYGFVESGAPSSIPVAGRSPDRILGGEAEAERSGA